MAQQDGPSGSPASAIFCCSIPTVSSLDESNLRWRRVASVVAQRSQRDRRSSTAGGQSLDAPARNRRMAVLWRTRRVDRQRGLASARFISGSRRATGRNEPGQSPGPVNGRSSSQRHGDFWSGLARRQGAMAGGIGCWPQSWKAPYAAQAGGISTTWGHEPVDREAVAGRFGDPWRISPASSWGELLLRRISRTPSQLIEVGTTAST